jgi:hypothetical protein
LRVTDFGLQRDEYNRMNMEGARRPPIPQLGKQRNLQPGPNPGFIVLLVNPLSKRGKGIEKTRIP